jgi:hypothetical protein
MGIVLSAIFKTINVFCKKIPVVLPKRKRDETVNGPIFPNEQNFDLNKSRQKFHHSLKEHHKISSIPKFRCEML